MNIPFLVSGILKSVISFIINYIAVLLPLFAGIYFSLKTRFVQVRCFFEGLGELFRGQSREGISPFAALSASIGSAVGVGNVVGAATAIILGGAGAVFWMWVAAFFGMAVVYAEAKTAVETRERGENGHYGGPAVYILKTVDGKTGRILSAIFSLSAIAVLGFSGGALQSSAVARTVFESFKIPPFWVSGHLALATLIAAVGGGRRVSRICEKTVVIMSVVFLTAMAAVLIKNVKYIPQSLALIFKSAFRVRSAAGGVAAFFLTAGQGVRKGIYSNEAGLGTSPHIHAASNYTTPHKAGVVAMQSVFVDSFIILTATSLVMLTDALRRGFTEFGTFSPEGWLAAALSSVFGKGGSAVILSLSLLLFGYSSIISWNYIGRLNAEWLFGPRCRLPYFVFTSVFIAISCIFSSDFLWNLSDFLNVIMIVTNCTALILYKKGSKHR